MGQAPLWPTRCSEVSFDLRDGSYGEPPYEADVGDLLWNPKGGEGHVIVAEVRCNTEHDGRRVDCGCGGWGMHPCPSSTLVCECGKDGSWRDHHYTLLARRGEATNREAQAPLPASVSATPEGSQRGRNER